jgi:Heterokaryon incompatibility protein Het-C
MSSSNPKDYADNQDARQHDKRLRPPVRQIELDIDPETGMKNYIANEKGDWATSAAYIKYSISRSIHYGRTYTSGGHNKGKEEDLYEALRCLGQGLHTLEDFGAHSNYCELVLRELGFHNVFPHVGAATQINLRGQHVFPLVTGTFGMVDFFHSVLGEANDHFTQSELTVADDTLLGAESSQQSSSSSASSLNTLTSLLGKIPGTKELVTEAEELKQRSNLQAESNRSRHLDTGYTYPSADSYSASPAFEQTRSGPDGEYESSRIQGLQDIDPQKTVSQIYPILQFRDKVVRRISSIVEKIPGLEKIVDKITETVTLFAFSLLAPFIRPLINVASKSLQSGSMGVVQASGNHQYEVWDDPHCTDPTHSMLSKDHFANILNEPAGNVAAAILKYVVPRVLYAWQHIDVSVDQVVDDCVRVFHHPTCRDRHNEAHSAMFAVVQNWVHSRPDRGRNLDDLLSAQGVRAGKNLIKDPSSSSTGQSHGQSHGHSHGGGGFPAINNSLFGGATSSHQNQHQQSQSASIPWNEIQKLPIPGISSVSNVANKLSGFSNLLSGGLSRDNPEETQEVANHADVPYEQYQYHAAPSTIPRSLESASYEQYGNGHGYGQEGAYQASEAGAYGASHGHEHSHNHNHNHGYNHNQHGHSHGHGHNQHHHDH